MPSELGSYLQRHREALGLRLEEVEGRTRIRRRILDAIERGAWDELPPSVYTRGLIRNYAKAMGLSPAAVLRMYAKERPHEARVPEPQLLSQPLLQQPRFSFELVAALGLLAIAVVLFGWMVTSVLLPQVREVAMSGPDDPNPLAAETVASPTPTVPPPTATPRVVRAVPLPEGSAGQETSSPSEPGVGEMPALEDTAPTAAPGRLELVVTATSDAWLMVRADGQQVFLNLLRRGESRRWTANERFRVRTGNAGGTIISLNGRRLPSLGGAGDVAEREWRLLPDGNIEQSG